LKKCDRSWEFWEQTGYAAIARIISPTISRRIHSLHHLLDGGDKKNDSHCADTNIERKVDQPEVHPADHHSELQQMIQPLEEKHSSTIPLEEPPLLSPPSSKQQNE